MIKSSFNQLANTWNPFQGDSVKSLCVCSAGLLRSPSIAKYLTEEQGHNTRACGSAVEYALVPLSESLLHWCDEIHVVKERLSNVAEAIKELRGKVSGFHTEGFDKPVYVYDIPDQFGTFDDRLMEIIHSQYRKIKDTGGVQV